MRLVEVMAKATARTGIKRYRFFYCHYIKNFYKSWMS